MRCPPVSSWDSGGTSRCIWLCTGHSLGHVLLQPFWSNTATRSGGCQCRMTAALSRTGGAIAIRNELLCTPRSQRPRVWLSRRRRFAFGRFATRSGVLVMPLCLRSAMICARRFGFFLRSSIRTPVCSGCPDRRVAIAGEGRHHALRLPLFLCCVLSCFCKTQWVA
jgi:hypothetical protein